MPFLTIYNASKFAVVTISECLHYELEMTGAPVKVSVLCPGFVRTNIGGSDRNRPAALRDDAPRSEAAQAFMATFQGMIESGKPPAEVADVVFDAIRHERFWIFPHPDMLEGVRQRADGVLAQINPTFVVPPELQR